MSTKGIVTLLGFCLIWTGHMARTHGAETWTLELQIAADPELDVELAREALSVTDAKVYQNTELVAKWVPVLDRMAGEIAGEPNLVARRSEDGKVELLVLVDPDTVTEEYVTGIYPGQDRYGQLAIDIKVNAEGQAKLMELSKKNVGRYAAEIMDGIVYEALQIRTTLYDRFQIPARFTKDEIDAITARTLGGIRWSRFLGLAAVVAAAVIVLVFTIRKRGRTDS